MARGLPETWKSSISMYVPNATFAAEVDIRSSIYDVDLGAPIALNATGILSAQSIAAAATVVQSSFAAAYTGVGDSVMGRYGRVATMVASGASTATVRLDGRDYLGQKMSETFTLNGTTIVVGKKAFARVEQAVILTTTGATTVNIGWGDVLGLPYKTFDLLKAYQDGVVENDEAEVAFVTQGGVTVGGAAGTVTAVAPFSGWLTGWDAEITTAQTAAATAMAATVNGGAQANASGTIPVAAAGFLAGKRIARANWVAVVKGDSVVLTSAAGGAGGVINGSVIFERANGIFAPADSTTVSATTGDTRGTYAPQNATNGTRVFRVTGKADRTNLYGVAHFAA